MTATTKRLMGELVKLNKYAESDTVEARRLLSASSHHGTALDRNIAEAVARSLLAIEGRLAMATLFFGALVEQELGK